MKRLSIGTLVWFHLLNMSGTLGLVVCYGGFNIRRGDAIELGLLITFFSLILFSLGADFPRKNEERTYAETLGIIAIVFAAIISIVWVIQLLTYVSMVALL